MFENKIAIADPPTSNPICPLISLLYSLSMLMDFLKCVIHYALGYAYLSKEILILFKKKYYATNIVILSGYLFRALRQLERIQFFEIPDGSGTLNPDSQTKSNYSRIKQGVDVMKTTFDVTEIKVYPLKNGDGNIKAFAHIVLNGVLRLNSLKVVKGENGLFVGYPAEKGKDGQYYNIVNPITRETRNLIQDIVLANYEKAVAA